MSYTYDVLLLLYFSNTMSTNFTYTLSLHDALPISARQWRSFMPLWTVGAAAIPLTPEQEGELLELTRWLREQGRSEEHTSELQSRGHLVCRLLLEKKNKKNGHIVFWSKKSRSV